MCMCVCVCVALGIHHAMRMRHIVIVACPAVHYISTLSHKRHNFREKRLLNTGLFKMIVGVLTTCHTQYT